MKRLVTHSFSLIMYLRSGYTTTSRAGLGLRPRKRERRVRLKGNALVFIRRVLFEAVGNLSGELGDKREVNCQYQGDTFPNKLFQSVWLMKVSMGTRRTCRGFRVYAFMLLSTPRETKWYPISGPEQQPKADPTSRLLPFSLKVTSSRSETPTLRPSAVKRVSISGIEVAPSRANDTTWWASFQKNNIESEKWEHLHKKVAKSRQSHFSLAFRQRLL